jgi:hypothetical protein
MNRPFLVRIHLTGAIGALILIAAFFVSSVILELATETSELHALRLAIVVALPVLVGCLVAAGLTGRKLAGPKLGGPKLGGTVRAAIVRRKQRRLQLAAAIGLVVLIPCAVILYLVTPTVTVQITELVAGAVNITLLGLNVRDGRRLTRRPRQPQPRLPHMVDTTT